MWYPTPSQHLTDPQGRPYFLWDEETTLEDFRRQLAQPSPHLRAAALGKVMRQGKPDDVFLFATVQEVRSLWPLLLPYLGQTRAFWSWLLQQWEAKGLV